MMPWLAIVIFLGIGVLLFGIAFLFLVWNMDADIVLLYKEKFGAKPGKRFPRKVVWITGASSGIGEALAVRLAAAGARLVLSARREKELEAVKQRCLEVSSGKLAATDIMVLPMDMLDLAKHEVMLRAVLAKFEKLDVLVNNAGRSQRALFTDIDLAVDQEMFDIDVFSVLNLTRVVLKEHFIPRNKGHFVVTSSVAGKFGVPGSASYNAAKHALHGYFDTLRIEHGFRNNIAVTVICPGPVASEFLTAAFTGTRGEVYGSDLSSKDRRSAMTTHRCAELMAVAIANKVEEAWICRQPVLAVLYGIQYLPFVSRKLLNRFGVALTNKIRSHGDKQQ